MNPIRHFLFVGGPCDGQTLRVECEWGSDYSVIAPETLHVFGYSAHHADYRLDETSDPVCYRHVEPSQG